MKSKLLVLAKEALLAFIALVMLTIVRFIARSITRLWARLRNRDNAAPSPEAVG